MKVAGKPVAASVGVWFIGLALIWAALIPHGMRGAESPFLFVCIFGGLFVAVPAVLGIGIVLENRRNRVRTTSQR